jgi:hypothetical protein
MADDAKFLGSGQRLSTWRQVQLCYPMFEIEHFGLLNDGKKWLAAPSVLKRCPWDEKVNWKLEKFMVRREC